MIDDETSEKVRRCPLTLGLFVVIIGCVAVVNARLAWDHVRHADTYRALGLSYSPWLRALFATGWSAMFGAFSVGLFRRRAWARRWLVILVSNYGAFSVLWLIVYAQADFARDQIPFRAAVAVSAAALTAWFMRRNCIRQSFEWNASNHAGENIIHD